MVFSVLARDDMACPLPTFDPVTHKWQEGCVPLLLGTKYRTDVPVTPERRTGKGNGFCGCLHSSSPIGSVGLFFFLRPSLIARDQPERALATNGSRSGMSSSRSKSSTRNRLANRTPTGPKNRPMATNYALSQHLESPLDAVPHSCLRSDS